VSLTQLQPGDPTEIGTYALVGRLGAGGMGVVYLARAGDGGLVALKQLRPELSDDPGFRVRFGREASALLRVQGPFTARVLAVEFDASPPYLVMEYVGGRSLAEHVEIHGPIAEPALNGVAVALAEALAAMHHAGVVHRDLKPSNVIMADQGPKVIDFGIAQIAEATALTRTGTTVGTPGFLAPEQISGSVGPAADIFSWAVTIGYAATGRAPFGTGPADAVLYRVLHDEPDLSGTPVGTEAVLRSALSKNPDTRPTADELLHLLDANATTVLSGRPTTRTLPTQKWHVPRLQDHRRSRRRWVIAAIATLGILTTAALFFLGLHSQNNPSQPTAARSFNVSQSPSSMSAAPQVTTPAPTSEPADLTQIPANSGSANLSMPNTIGDLTWASDQSTANTLRDQLSSSGISNPYAIAYQDQYESSRKVVLWGGTGSDFAGDDQVRRDAFFRSGNAEFTGETVSNRAPVPTGAAGGSAECETVTGSSSLAFCVWVGNNALLGLIFQGYSRSDSDALAPTVLSAVVSY
jgi:serine/threonine protein kinase